jgi:hypothetical protein
LLAIHLDKGGAFIMRHLTSPIGVFAIVCALLANAGPARAATHTWVSATGTNTGLCPATAPCRTLQYALTQTVAGGVISVLSSGDYASVTIDKSINIVAEGVEATILFLPGGPGIVVNAPGGVVVLRGLTIQPSSTANIGISFVAGTALHVYNCFIRKTNTGIKFSPASGTSELSVADSTITGATSHGLFIFPTGSGSAKVMIDRVRVNGSASVRGIYVYGGSTGSINGTVRDSVLEGGNYGVHVVENNSGTSNVMIDRSALVHNTGYGAVASGAGATIRIGDSVVTGNNIGLYAVGGGVVASYGTNKVNSNNSDGTPLTPVDYK